MDLSANNKEAPSANMSPPRRICLRAPAISSSAIAGDRLHYPRRANLGPGAFDDDDDEGGDGCGAGRWVQLLEPTPPPAGAPLDEPFAANEPPPAPAAPPPRLRLRLRPPAQPTEPRPDLQPTEPRPDLQPTEPRPDLQPMEPRPDLQPMEPQSEAQVRTSVPRTLRLIARPPGPQSQQQQPAEAEAPREGPMSPAMPLDSLPRAGKRLRSSAEWCEAMSPTPTPQGMYSCGVTPSIRRHSKTGAPLPSGPTPIDYDIAEYVETKYEVGVKIGEGTYAEVYIGQCRATGETVALKRLKVLQGLDGFPVTSLREVIALKHIASVCKRCGDSGKMSSVEEVIGLRDVMLSKSRNGIYLVFPYISCSMAGLLERRFIFTDREIAYVFKKLVTALKKLHEMGIIHRDVKADNVLIQRDGSVKLGDFGLCVFEGSGRCALTPSLINLSYRPPEMLLGMTAYDEKVDIWSIGCFLAQMYLRVPPFYHAHRQGNNNNNNNNADPRHHRRAETELEQLSLITDVLGPLSNVDAGAFPPERCQHTARLEQLRKALSSSASWPSFTPSMNSLFQPSLLFSEFGGFASWFVATAEHRRRAPCYPIPSKECVDVLTAIFQMDPRRRPTASQLLEMPFFDLHRGAPRRTPRTDADAEISEDYMAETHIRRELAEKLSQYLDSHIAPAAKNIK